MSISNHKEKLLTHVGRVELDHGQLRSRLRVQGLVAVRVPSTRTISVEFVLRIIIISEGVTLGLVVFNFASFAVLVSWRKFQKISRNWN